MSTRTAADPIALIAVEDPELLLDAVTVTDTDGRITAVNRAFTRLHGYEPEEVIGQRPSVLSSGLQPSSFGRQLWETISRGTPWEGELIDRGADGALRTVRSRITPVRGPDGRISHFVAVQREIGSPLTSGKGQLRVDVSGRCTYADRPAARLFRPDDDPMPLLGRGLLSLLDVDDATTLREVVEHAITTGRSHRVDVVGHDGYVQCAVRADPSSYGMRAGAVAHLLCHRLPDRS
jgi:PAS domain S-box-containing protein